MIGPVLLNTPVPHISMHDLKDDFLLACVPKLAHALDVYQLARCLS